jgi:cobalamin biosynthesis Mg chelatase CobN
MLKTCQVALVLSLLVPLAYVDASPSAPSHSFKSGFSSQRASSSSPSSASSSSSKPGGGFGSFSRRPASNDAAASSSRPSGGFGSFGSGAAAPQKSDSALSQKLNKNTAEANALRTLDARRQAQADAARDTRPVPGHERSDSGPRPPTYAPPPAYPQPQPQAPVVVRQDSGLGHVIAGAVLANAARGAHANGNNGYPGAYPSTPGGGTMAPAPARSGGMSFFGLFVTLCMLALVGWIVYFAWRRLRRARDAKKPNYSFERN